MKRTRIRLFLAAVVPAFLLAIALGIVLGRRATRRVVENWPLVRPGMSKAEVRALLGTPSSIYPVQHVKSDSFVGAVTFTLALDSFQEKWAYGARPLLSTRSGLPFVGPAGSGLMIPDDADRVIYFSADGVVTKKAYPYRRTP